MIEEIQHITDLTPLHWALAYTGLMVHIIMKLANIRGSFTAGLNRRFVLTTIASFLSIPAILLICTDTSMKDLLPINYLTAFLAGYQTQSLINNISQLSSRALPKQEKEDNAPEI